MTHGQGDISPAQRWSKDISLWLGYVPKVEDFRVEAAAQTVGQFLVALNILSCLNS